MQMNHKQLYSCLVFQTFRTVRVYFKTGKATHANAWPNRQYDEQRLYVEVRRDAGNCHV
jgi:hypothetical protein